MALKDDLSLLAMVGATILQRHTNLGSAPVIGDIQSGLDVAEAILDEIDNRQAAKPQQQQPPQQQGPSDPPVKETTI